MVVNRPGINPYPQTGAPGGWGYCGTAQDGVSSPWDQNNPPSTGYRCLDAPGSGASDLLTGNFPNKVDSVTGTITWPHQAQEPIYEWMDSWVLPPQSGGFFWGGISPVSVQNSDFYLD